MRRILIISVMLLLLITVCGGCHAKMAAGSFILSADLTFDDFTFKATASDEQDALQRRAQARAAAEIRRLRAVAAAKVQATP